MGITSNDIAAQRAMLARGEEKRKDDRKQAERERLRDTFAAAALTGMIGAREWPIDSDEAAHYCYRVADAMLRERERTNHDAAPEARADSRPLGNPVASAVTGTGNQPAPPSVETDGFSPGSRTGQINRTPERESPRRECGESSLRDVPQLDNSRAAGGPEPSCSTKRDTTQPRNGAVGEPQCQGFVQKNLTLTRVEREAIAIDLAAEFLNGRAVAATLRKLLERLK